MIPNLIVLFLMFFYSAEVRSEGRLEKIAEELSQEKEQLLVKEQQKRSLLGDLYAVNKTLKKLNGERSKIEKNLRDAEESVSSITEIIQTLEEKINVQRIQLRSRMKSLSKLHGQGVARLIFSAQSSSQLDVNLKIFKIITERDFRLLMSYRENVKSFKSQKKRLSSEELRYAKLKKSLDNKEKVLSSELDKKGKMLQSIDSSRVLHMAKLKKLRLESNSESGNEQEISKLQAIEDLFTKQMFEEKGRLRRPVGSNIAQGYGFHRDPQSGTKIRFKGVLFDSTPGENVVSVYSGKVSYIGWLEGYGQTVIVDHGDQYFTVYSNQTDIRVKVGERIKAGDVIGHVSEYESFLGKGLYFEIRHFSEPEDPVNWLEGSAS